MQTVRTRTALRSAVAAWRRSRERIAFVPTMGNLHDGHLRLVERAFRFADRVVVSIFVNPMQFGEGEDYANYPRTPEEDSAKLVEAGVDLLFTPAVEEMYPDGPRSATRVEVAELSGILCGAVRPGHFAGVATVVAKLFNLVQPDVAVFGEKDYQQLIVIRRLVADLCFPVDVIGVPTIREADGLAMSSRNSYLTPEERGRAPALYRALCEAGERVRRGGAELDAVEAEGLEKLRVAGFTPDYFTVRRAQDLVPAGAGDMELVILAAGRLGWTRLIDNVIISLKEGI